MQEAGQDGEHLVDSWMLLFPRSHSGGSYRGNKFCVTEHASSTRRKRAENDHASGASGSLMKITWRFLARSQSAATCHNIFTQGTATSETLFPVLALGGPGRACKWSDKGSPL
eukprot:365803-Chlamydomonas_euryale.AAC.6